MPAPRGPPGPHQVQQLGDLFVETVDVLFDDVRELLDLHALVVKQRFPLRH